MSLFCSHRSYHRNSWSDSPTGPGGGRSGPAVDQSAASSTSSSSYLKSSSLSSSVVVAPAAPAAEVGSPNSSTGSTGSGGHRSYNSKQRLNNGHLSSSSSSYRDATTQCFWAMRNMVHRVSNLT